MTLLSFFSFIFRRRADGKPYRIALFCRRPAAEAVDGSGTVQERGREEGNTLA